MAGQAAQIGLLAYGWIAGLLDEITAEHDGGVTIGDDGDQVVAGMAASWMGDRHRRSAEIEFGLADEVLRRTECCDGACHLVGIGTVAHGMGMQFSGVVCDRRRDFRRAVNGCAVERRRSEDVVEVIVRQHDMTDWRYPLSRRRRP